jgi:3-oxoacyl-[acyl-carrier protein] reductase
MEASSRIVPRSLGGRTAIVTGSGRNIGRAIALALAEAGANVVINGHRNVGALDEVVDECREKGVGALACLADVGCPDAVSGMVEAARARFGSVDIAVSNVSVRKHQPFLEISVEDWQRTLNSNLSSAFYLARAVLPHMQKAGWGRIVHISGRDGFRPKPNRAHNVTCKAGVFALSKAIALEFGQYGITANTVAPGIVDTERDPVHYPGYVEEYERRRQLMPTRRLGVPSDIASAVHYLCQDEARYMTGQIMHVNGGEHMF